MRRKAGRTNSSKVAADAAGLPGSPKTTDRPAVPNNTGLPGLMRTFQKPSSKP